MATMTKEKANKVYDLLVSVGGAYEPDRDSFVYHHTENKDGLKKEIWEVVRDGLMEYDKEMGIEP